MSLTARRRVRLTPVESPVRGRRRIPLLLLKELINRKTGRHSLRAPISRCRGRTTRPGLLLLRRRRLLLRIGLTKAQAPRPAQQRHNPTFRRLRLDETCRRLLAQPRVTFAALSNYYWIKSDREVIFLIPRPASRPQLRRRRNRINQKSVRPVPPVQPLHRPQTPLPCHRLQEGRLPPH